MARENRLFGPEPPHPLKPYDKLIINAALSGVVPGKRDTPFVPVTVEEVVGDALRCVSAGASILHIHARDDEGAPTHRAGVFARIIEGIRRESPEAVICATTSGRTYGDFHKRSEVLDLDGAAKPDMASLTLGSLNFPDQASVNSPETIRKLAEKMAARGIRPELEVFDPGMVNTAKYLCERGYLSPPLYFNVILGSVYSTQAKVSDLSYLVNELPPGALWAGGGIGVFQLPVNAASIVMGGHVRVGIEDCIWYDSAKRELTTNERSIGRLVRIAAELGREIATPEEARGMLGLESRIPGRKNNKFESRPAP
ncbi:MAG: 3-keto-5-aminohexanoate cleavage protein [Nitrospirota bacterium]